MSLSLSNAIKLVEIISETGPGFFPANAPCWRSYDALVLLCNVLHMAPGQGSKLWVEWCFCSTRIIPEDDKHALGCLERGCQDVRQGPMPAHPTRQLPPARRPSRNNLRWAELSVWSVMFFRAGVKVSKIRDANWWQRDAKWFQRLTKNNILTKTCKHYYKHKWDKIIRLEGLNDAFIVCQYELFLLCSDM